MDRYLSCADTAKLLRAALNAAFPGTKFSVRSSTYSMGASIQVTWTDGPLEPAVEAITNRYQSVDFDGMTDSTHHRDSTLLGLPDGSVEEVRFGSHYVFTTRQLSPGYAAKLTAICTDIVAADEDYSARAFSECDWYDGIVTPYGRMWKGTGRTLMLLVGEHVPPSA